MSVLGWIVLIWAGSTFLGLLLANAFFMLAMPTAERSPKDTRFMMSFCAYHAGWKGICLLYGGPFSLYFAIKAWVRVLRMTSGRSKLV